MLGNIVRWGLTVVVLLAAVIGVLFITRGTAVRRVRGVGADGTPVGATEPEFAATVALLAGAVILPGNRVELALNGDGTYERLWADLRSATRSITLQMYYAEPGRLAARSRYEHLLGAGVRVYEYQPSTPHAKTFVVDGLWSSVGTMNFDNRSLALNDECTLMVLDKSFGGRMEEMFFADLERSEEINLEVFRKRSPLWRVAEWGANLITWVL